MYREGLTIDREDCREFAAALQGIKVYNRVIILSMCTKEQGRKESKKEGRKAYTGRKGGRWSGRHGWMDGWTATTFHTSREIKTVMEHLYGHTNDESSLTTTKIKPERKEDILHVEQATRSETVQQKNAASIT